MNADNLRPENGADEAMRRLLNDAVSDVDPREGLDAIRSRTTVRSIHSKRPWLLGAGAAVVATAATIAAVAALGNSPGTSTSPPPFAGSPSPSADVGTVESDPPRPSQDPSPTKKQTRSQAPAPAVTASVPVYYLGEVSRPSEGGQPVTQLRLYREWHDVTGSDAEPVLAVREMLQNAPRDGDYGSPWPRNADVRSVSHQGGVITVDLTGPVQDANVGAEPAEMAVQQLVYTVQAALSVAGDGDSTDPVLITVDGQPVDDLWGHVDTSAPIARADETGTQAPIWVTAPSEGATVSSPVEVTGIAQVFEANVSWRLLRNGAVVDEGYTTASEGAPAFGEYSFTIRPEPGTYTIEVFESSALDGSATYVDSKTFTVG